MTIDGKIVTATCDSKMITFRKYRCRKTTTMPLADAYVLSTGQSLLALR